MADQEIAKRYPYFQFYPSDWRGDPALRLCSLEARGLWIEMLCIMHEAEPYGHLIVKGQPIDEKQLAIMVGISKISVKKLLKILENSGVFSKRNDGIIYSRKMVRDFANRCNNKKNGSLGGNPSLKTVNPPVKGGVKPHIPDTIYQIPEVLDKSNTKRAGRAASAEEVRSELLTVLPAEMAEALIQHRRAKKAALTPMAAKLLVKAFTEHGNPVAAVEAMIANGWQGFKPEWLAPSRSNPAKQKISAITEAILLMDDDYGQSETHTVSASSLVQQIPRLISNGS